MLRLSIRTLAIVAIASSLSVFSTTAPVTASDKSLRVIGGGQKHGNFRHNRRANNRHVRRNNSSRYRRNGQLRRTLREAIDATRTDTAASRINSIGSIVVNQDGRAEFTDGFLRNKVNYSPQRSIARILHVTDEQLALGEERAARREARMLESIKSIEFGYYRSNEAYDVRFPSIVYLEAPRK